MSKEDGARHVEDDEQQRWIDWLAGEEDPELDGICDRSPTN